MDLKTQLNESMKDAMRSGDTVRKNTVRFALAAIKQAEVDKQTTLDDPAVIALLQKEIKNRKEAIEEAKRAGREDLIQNNQAEIVVLEAFLPAAMPEEELTEIVKAAIAETGATSPADMGKVMKVAMEKVAGRRGDARAPALEPEDMRRHILWRSFYVNPDDPRGWVPKVSGPGWTVNFRTRGQVVLFVGLIVLSLAGAVLLTWSLLPDRLLPEEALGALDAS